MPTPPFSDPTVEAAFSAFPEPKRTSLLWIRGLIFDMAAELEGVAPVEEALRWGEPSYLTTASGTGTMLRLGGRGPGQVALLVHCQTDLIATLRARYGDALSYEGTRAVVFGLGDDLPEEALRDAIGLALTYRLRKKAILRRQKGVNATG